MLRDILVCHPLGEYISLNNDLELISSRVRWNVR